MEQITLSLLGGALFWAVDKVREKRRLATTTAPVPEDVTRFTLTSPTPEQVETFTNVREGVRRWDADIAVGMPRVFASRSAVAVPAGPLEKVAPTARVYRLLPLQGGLVASDVLEAARAERKTVLGSLSIATMPLGGPEPVLLVVGGPELASFAQLRGDFAVIPDPARVEAAKPVEPAVSAAPAIVPAVVPTHLNGASETVELVPVPVAEAAE